MSQTLLTLLVHLHHHHHQAVSMFCTVNRQGVANCIRSIFTR